VRTPLRRSQGGTLHGDLPVSGQTVGSRKQLRAALKYCRPGDVRRRTLPHEDIFGESHSLPDSQLTSASFTCLLDIAHPCSVTVEGLRARIQRL
jgi:hypothetical protein